MRNNQINSQSIHQHPNILPHKKKTSKGIPPSSRIPKSSCSKGFFRRRKSSHTSIDDNNHFEVDLHCHQIDHNHIMDLNPFGGNHMNVDLCRQMNIFCHLSGLIIIPQNPTKRTPRVHGFHQKGWAKSPLDVHQITLDLTTLCMVFTRPTGQGFTTVFQWVYTTTNVMDLNIMKIHLI